MLQLFLIGIVGYIILYFLAKSRIFNGLTNAFPIINSLLVTILVIFVVIKSGLIRVLATMLGTMIVFIQNFFSTIF